MFVVSLLGVLWAASGYVSTFTDASNSIYDVDEARPFWKLKPLQIVVTLVLILIAAMVALALVLSGRLSARSGSATPRSSCGATRSGRRWSCVLVIFGVLYYTGPNAKVSCVRWITGGAVVALIAWIAASIAFAPSSSSYCGCG